MMSALLVAMSLGWRIRKAAETPTAVVCSHQTEPQAGWSFIRAALPSALSRMYTFSLLATNICCGAG